MLKYEFEKDLLDALEIALKHTNAIPSYIFNVIVPVIEMHTAQQSVKSDGVCTCGNKMSVGSICCAECTTEKKEVFSH
jgi:hypothetical protein